MDILTQIDDEIEETIHLQFIDKCELPDPSFFPDNIYQVTAEGMEQEEGDFPVRDDYTRMNRHYLNLKNIDGQGMKMHIGAWTRGHTCYGPLGTPCIQEEGPAFTPPDDESLHEYLNLVTGIAGLAPLERKGRAFRLEDWGGFLVSEYDFGPERSEAQEASQPEETIAVFIPGESKYFQEKDGYVVYAARGMEAALIFLFSHVMELNTAGRFELSGKIQDLRRGLEV